MFSFQVYLVFLFVSVSVLEETLFVGRLVSWLVGWLAGWLKYELPVQR